MPKVGKFLFKQEEIGFRLVICIYIYIKQNFGGHWVVIQKGLLCKFLLKVCMDTPSFLREIK